MGTFKLAITAIGIVPSFICLICQKSNICYGFVSFRFEKKKSAFRRYQRYCIQQHARRKKERYLNVVYVIVFVFNALVSSTLLFNLFVSFSVCNTRDAPMYFCERIYKSMAYYPPDYSGLIRDIVSRSEVSKLNQNKRLYLQRKTSLPIRMCSSFFAFYGICLQMGSSDDDVVIAQVRQFFRFF